MKKHFTFLPNIISVFLMLVFLASCGDSHPPPVEEPAPINPTIDSLRTFFEALHPNDQRAVFEGLPPEMKYALLDNHWKHLLTETDDPREEAFIQGLMDNLKPEYFADVEVFEKEGAEFFGAQMEAGLTIYKNDLSKVAAVVGIAGNEGAEVFIAENAALKECECNIKKDLCVFGDCGTFDCKTSKWGCGPGWLWACDGMCLL